MSEQKTARELASEQLNKRIAKAIANRLHAKKRLEAEIKKLDKEIEQIEKGELVPDTGASDEEAHLQSRIEELEREVQRLKQGRQETQRLYPSIGGGGYVIGGGSTRPRGGTFYITTTTTANSNNVRLC